MWFATPPRDRLICIDVNVDCRGLICKEAVLVISCMPGLGPFSLSPMDFSMNLMTLKKMQSYSDGPIRNSERLLSQLEDFLSKSLSVYTNDNKYDDARLYASTCTKLIPN